LKADVNIEIDQHLFQSKESKQHILIDLADAVNRQFKFASKMVNFSWSRSPFAQHTLGSSISRYDQFFQLMASSSGTVLAPTLEIDLVWHTHQLSPSNYRKYCFEKAGRFINHNDTISEGEVVSSFGNAKEMYQKQFGMSYGLCLCWHCEGSRHSDLSKEKLSSTIQDALAKELARKERRGLPLASNLAGFQCHDCGTHPDTTCLRGHACGHDQTLERPDPTECGGCNGECGNGGCGSCSSMPTRVAHIPDLTSRGDCNGGCGSCDGSCGSCGAE
jgi:hypothetical protein